MGSDQTEHDSPRIVRRSRNHVEHLLDGRADLVEIPGHIADPVDPIAEFAQLVLDDGEPTHDVIVDLHARFSGHVVFAQIARHGCLPHPTVRGHSRVLASSWRHCAASTRNPDPAYLIGCRLTRDLLDWTTGRDRARSGVDAAQVS